MKKRITLIKNARIVNEGEIINRDILIENEYIKEISESISPKSADVHVFDAENNFVLPGVIDDQVHFREPGLTHKATIETESKAAVAGGITTFIEMQNTNQKSASGYPILLTYLLFFMWGFVWNLFWIYSQMCIKKTASFSANGLIKL